MADKLIKQFNAIILGGGLKLSDEIYVQRPATDTDPDLDFKLSGDDIIDFLANNYFFPNDVRVIKPDPSVNLFDSSTNGLDFGIVSTGGQLIIGDVDGYGTLTHNAVVIDPSAQTLALKNANSTLGGNVIITENMLADVATSGAYGDLSGTPSLATVATSGNYSDLSGTPTLPTGVFLNIAVATQPTVTAGNLSDTVTFQNGANMVITTSGNTITFAASGTVGTTAASMSVVASGFTKMSTADTDGQTALEDIDSILSAYGTMAEQDTDDVAITGGTIEGATVTVPHNGLKVNNNSTYNTTIDFTSTLSIGRTLSIITGDADRTITINGNVILSGTNTGDQTITLTGAVTGSGTGSFATTLAANIVTYAKFQQIAANTLVGNPTNSTANISGITLGAAFAFSGSVLQTVAMTGDVTTIANSFATVIGNNVVSNAKFRQSAGLSLVGNAGSSIGNVADITAALDGQVLVRSGSALVFGAVNLSSTNAVTGILSGLKGGTGNGFVAISGPSTTLKTFILPNANDTIACLGQVNGYTAQQYVATTALVDAATITWDLNTAQTASITLGGNRTLANPTNMKNGATYILRIKQDGSGHRTLAYGTAYKWPNGTDPVLSLNGNALDILTFTCDGTNMYGVASLNFS